jgi:hypothetical protein
MAERRTISQRLLTRIQDSIRTFDNKANMLAFLDITNDEDRFLGAMLTPEEMGILRQVVADFKRVDSYSTVPPATLSLPVGGALKDNEDFAGALKDMKEWCAPSTSWDELSIQVTYNPSYWTLPRRIYKPGGASAGIMPTDLVDAMVQKFVMVEKASRVSRWLDYVVAECAKMTEREVRYNFTCLGALMKDPEFNVALPGVNGRSISPLMRRIDREIRSYVLMFNMLPAEVFTARTGKAYLGLYTRQSSYPPVMIANANGVVGYTSRTNTLGG